MPNRQTTNGKSSRNGEEIKPLHPEDISAIEEALRKVGPFGEVHLVIENGRLRFIRTLRSESLDGDFRPNH